MVIEHRPSFRTSSGKVIIIETKSGSVKRKYWVVFDNTNKEERQIKNETISKRRLERKKHKVAFCLQIIRSWMVFFTSARKLLILYGNGSIRGWSRCCLCWWSCHGQALGHIPTCWTTCWSDESDLIYPSHSRNPCTQSFTHPIIASPFIRLVNCTLQTKIRKIPMLIFNLIIKGHFWCNIKNSNTPGLKLLPQTIG